MKRKKKKPNLLRKILRGAAVLAAIPAAFGIGAAAYFSAILPDSYYVEDAQSFSLPQYQILTPCAEEPASVPVLVSMTDAEKEAEKLENALSGDGETTRFTLLLGGVIPVKTVVVCETETRYVVPSGSVFGLKMLTDGAVIAALAPIETASGTSCPAEKAGLQAGDILCTADDTPIDCYDTLCSIISVAGKNGRKVRVTYLRDGAQSETLLSPVQALTGEWLAGIWVRDSSAGIGTITFYDPTDGKFAALGHGVCDADTGVLLPLQWGEVCGATILGVTRGTAGSPGELQGAFLSGGFSLTGNLGTNGLVSAGKVLQNLSCGLIGQADGSALYTAGDLMAICPRQEVHTGAATILSTIGGTSPQSFSVQIEKVSYSDEDSSRNIVLRITDPVLLAATGGIVQGMSGSPILQDGRIVGAVTHVFVSDPSRGYGIFAETMAEAMDGCS
jgi:stage IV sporulation protein B